MKALLPLAITAAVVGVLVLSREDEAMAAPSPLPGPPGPNPLPPPPPAPSGLAEGDILQVPIANLPADALPAYVLDTKSYPTPLPKVTGLILQLSSVGTQTVQGYIVGAYFQENGVRTDSTLPSDKKVGPVIVPISATQSVA